MERSTVEAELERLTGGEGPVAGFARQALGDGAVEVRLRAAILALAGHRAPGGSTCPSDAARAVGGDGWRDLMAVTRRIAADLAVSGKVELTQGGRTLDPKGSWRGPIRIRARDS